MNKKTIPKIVSLLFVMRWPLVFSFVRKFIKYLVPNLKNTDFIHWFECQFWNIICENNTFLSDTIYIWEWTKFTRRNIVITWDHKKWFSWETTLKEVQIWKNCWITTNVTILSWVTI
jgi:acetyltransferase-like isoleucine patch superfamily enzyme